MFGIFRIYLVIGIIILAIIVIALFINYKEEAIRLITGGNGTPSSEDGGGRSVMGFGQPTSVSVEPKFRIIIKGPRTIRIVWENLPLGTFQIKVFRSAIGETNWSQWKTVLIGARDVYTGGVDVTLGAG